MRTLRAAVIGAGHLGRIHARLLRSIDGVELVGIVDPLPAAREDVASELGIEPLAHHGQLIGRIDAAIVVTPSVCHHAVAMELIEAGIHLLVEKPLAATVSDAAAMVHAAESQGLVLQAGHVERFHPALSAAWPHIQQPRYIEATRTSGYSFRSTDIGVVLDLMIHDLDIALALAESRPVAVQASGLTVVGPHEDVAHARIEFANGCVANLSASRISFEATRRMCVHTSAGYASIDFAARTARSAQPTARQQLDPTVLGRLSPEEKGAMRDRFFTDVMRLEELPVEKNNALLEEQRDFVAAIQTGRAPCVSGGQALAVMQLAGQVLEAIAAHDRRATERTNDVASEAARTAPHVAGSVPAGPHWLRSTPIPTETRRRAG